MNKNYQKLIGSNGDLTIRINMKGNDEITQINQHFNEFIQDIDVIIDEVKDKSLQNISTVSELKEVNQQEAVQLFEINKSIKSGITNLKSDEERLHNITEATLKQIRSSDELNNKIIETMNLLQLCKMLSINKHLRYLKWQLQ